MPLLTLCWHSSRGWEIMQREILTARRAHVYRPGSEGTTWSKRKGDIPAESSGAKRCRRKFLRIFPEGFRDETYLAWERDYKWNAHLRWEEALNEPDWRTLLKQGAYVEAAAHAVRIESRTNLLFSFEKMALRDAVRSRE